MTPQEVWRQKQWYNVRCLRCGKPNETPRYLDCPACRDRVNARRRAVRAISRRVSAVAFALLLGALPAAAQGPLELGDAGPSGWPREPNRLRILDGSWERPLTDQTDRTPSVYIERTDNTNIADDAPIPNMAAVEILYLTTGRTPYWGGKSAIAAQQYTTAVGTEFPGSSTHNGGFFVSTLLPESHHAFAIGATTYAWIMDGTGPTRATGLEADVRNDRTDSRYDSLDGYNLGVAAINAGTKRSLYGLEVLAYGPTAHHEGGKGGFLTGIRIRDVFRGDETHERGAGISLEDWRASEAPGIAFLNASPAQGYITQYGDSIGVGARGQEPVLFVNVVTGELQVRGPDGKLRPVVYGRPDKTGFRPMGVR